MAPTRSCNSGLQTSSNETNGPPSTAHTVDMSVNSSSPSNSSIYLLVFHCSNSTVYTVIGTVASITRAFLLFPLSILVLYLGHQRWRQQRSFAKMSHSDIFTYHMAVFELIWVLGCLCAVYGYYVNLQEMMIVGVCAYTIAFYGEVLLHLLTCVERYLAVVHPIIYLGLRNARGVRIRNISIWCVWLTCIGSVGISVLQSPALSAIPLYCFLVFSLIVVSFCSLSILCVLIRPGPGEGGGDKERVDQLKKRAFLTILAIMGVLWLWLVGYLVSFGLYNSSLLSYSVRCVLSSSASLFNLPSSLVLPLLYLHRTGKVSCCRDSSE